MQLTEQETKPAVTRLKRAKGQLEAVLRMIDEGEDCEAIITQISAVSKAVNRTGMLLIATGMKRCIAEDGPESDKRDRLEKAMLSLS